MTEKLYYADETICQLCGEWFDILDFTFEVGVLTRTRDGECAGYCHKKCFETYKQNGYRK